MNAILQKITSSVYRDTTHAIRCALGVSAGALGHQVAKWQTEYQAGWRIASLGPDMSRAERFVQDCMTRHLLHSGLSASHWAMLVALYAPALTQQGRIVADQSEFNDMAEALEILLNSLEKPISQEFTGWCLLRWAQRMPPGRGTWIEWENRTDNSLRTLKRRCNETYFALNTIETAAKRSAGDLLRNAGLTS